MILSWKAWFGGKKAGPALVDVPPVIEPLLFPPDTAARLAAVRPLLLSYQEPSVARLLQAVLNHRGGVDASDTGVGKTYVTMAVAAILQCPVFVVCPKSVRSSWHKAEGHFKWNVMTEGYEKIRSGSCPELRFNTKQRTYQWTLPKDTLIVFDECHRLKNPATLNCAMGLAAIQQGYRVVGLSATAADNPGQMKFVGSLCQLFPPGEFLPWSRGYGAEPYLRSKYEGGTEVLKKIHRQIFPKHGTRVRIADLGNAFPETQVRAECYDLNGDTERVRQIYREMEQELVRLADKERNDATKMQCILRERLRARQRAELLKVPVLADIVRDKVQEGHSVVVFLNFNDSLDALARLLKTDCLLRGGQTDEDREEQMRRFQCLRQSRYALLCPTYSAQDIIQAKGRVHRAVGKHEPLIVSDRPSPILLANIRVGGVGISLHDLAGSKSIQRIFFAAGTVEEDICAQVREKQDRIETLNDGDLSTPTERAVVSSLGKPRSSQPLPPIIATRATTPPVIGQ